jgi:hypothetical protein
MKAILVLFDSLNRNMLVARMRGSDAPVERFERLGLAR